MTAHVAVLNDENPPDTQREELDETEIRRAIRGAVTDDGWRARTFYWQNKYEPPAELLPHWYQRLLARPYVQRELEDVIMFVSFVVLGIFIVLMLLSGVAGMFTDDLRVWLNEHGIIWALPATGIAALGFTAAWRDWVKKLLGAGMWRKESDILLLWTSTLPDLLRNRTGVDVWSSRGSLRGRRLVGRICVGRPGETGADPVYEYFIKDE